MDKKFLKPTIKTKQKPPIRKKSLREYLELYSKFKLKVKTAKDMQLDSLPQLKNDLDNFRNQVEEITWTTTATLRQLVSETATHTIKTSHLLHFFVPRGDSVSGNRNSSYCTTNCTGEKGLWKLAADIATCLPENHWQNFLIPVYHRLYRLYELWKNGVCKTEQSKPILWEGTGIFKVLKKKRTRQNGRIGANAVCHFSSDNGCQ